MAAIYIHTSAIGRIVLGEQDAPCSARSNGVACRRTRSRSRASRRKQQRPAVQAIPPALIEIMRARLLEEGRLRDAALLGVLA